ncbi:hypothetical protein OESDEN_06229 [Oesophagostomum dentatum]|uniref:C2H2-type domain-containing protein n=1 Tax=Oesophagostomum dentatum TaxID=61180 RepID=A0A0B1TCK6_OESDE|nr:hypothetical protein OESDEN_06229 [Oesophagostomum dentatum]
MSLHYTEDVCSLYPQIPSSMDDTTGLLRALKNGTDEVKGVLKYSCNVILECRCCRAIFRHPENFHKHKLTVCHAYHKRVTPSYEQLLKFQKKIAALYDPDQPSSSKVLDDDDDGEELVTEDTSYKETYDGMEEFCDYDKDGSPEIGEVVEIPEEGLMVYGVEEIDDGSASEIEEGEYIEPDECTSRMAAGSSEQCVSQATYEAEKEACSGDDCSEELNDDNAADDAISLTESPPRGPLTLAIFNDDLLNSPTENDYFGKDNAVTSPLLSLTQNK